MTARDDVLRELARFWRRHGTAQAVTCAVQLEDALNTRAQGERMARERLAREAALRLTEAE